MPTGSTVAGSGSETTGPDSFAPLVVMNSTVPVSLHFTEPVVPGLKGGDCTVVADGFCGKGEVKPFGQATETIEFGAACAGACDFRTINLAQGTLYLEETFTDFQCPGSCHPNRAEVGSGSLTDVIVGGTGSFEGATGTLRGTVRAAGRESQVKLSGAVVLASGG